MHGKPVIVNTVSTIWLRSLQAMQAQGEDMLVEAAWSTLC